jgi:hypothetical protein
VHVAPPVPQPSAVGVVHDPPRQQPAGHEVALHSHEPLTQAVPGAHVPLVPHAHVPAEHVCPVAPQSTHAAPFVPQVAVPVVLQVLPSQQPVGQLVGSHTHAPPRQRCPAAHAAPVPHAHAPLVQLSAVSGSHALQTAPTLPHAVTEIVVQTPPRQHPVVHDARHAAASTAPSPSTLVPSPPDPSPASSPPSVVPSPEPSPLPSPKLVSPSVDDPSSPPSVAPSPLPSADEPSPDEPSSPLSSPD